MTNFEYYKEEILEITNKGYAVAVIDNKPMECPAITYCDECQFKSRISCMRDRMKWLYEEHVEKPKLTKKERQFCELVDTGWIARDYDEKLFFYQINKPCKNGTYWKTKGNRYQNLSQIMFMDIDLDFTFITWEDEEPWSVEELLKLEVEE